MRESFDLFTGQGRRSFFGVVFRDPSWVLHWVWVGTFGRFIALYCHCFSHQGSPELEQSDSYGMQWCPRCGSWIKLL